MSHSYLFELLKPPGMLAMDCWQFLGCGSESFTWCLGWTYLNLFGPFGPFGLGIHSQLPGLKCSSY